MALRHWHRARRALAILLALWFIVSLMAATVHHCPVHDAFMPPPSAAPHSRDHAAMRHVPASQHEHHHGCSCLGQCCAAAPAAIITPRVLALEPSAPRPALPPFDGAEPAFRSARHRLPFANGPPRAIRA